ncbi:hypothetical protein EVAR_21690_1 [Eumeta japonica]|uniref:Uncharacterized protein n=1 Tax=Eumeta variegata TaxID=151549 RepID=A0A4C1W8R8_EUMVA|nr:hypothetical protein EVAR_21690_1 [Eumeta japonica]
MSKLKQSSVITAVKTCGRGCEGKDNVYVVGGVVQTARDGRALSPDLFSYLSPISMSREGRKPRPSHGRLASRRGRRSTGRRTPTHHPRIENDFGSMYRLASMRRPRSGLAGVVENCRECLYVLGGMDDEDNLNVVERYDFATDVWEDLEELLEPRCALAAGATLEVVVAAGGGLHWTYGFKADVEFYDPFQRRWVAQSPMPEPRAGAGTASIFSSKRQNHDDECDGTGPGCWREMKYKWSLLWKPTPPKQIDDAALHLGCRGRRRRGNSSSEKGPVTKWNSADKTGNHHKEMNEINYLKCLETQLIPNLPSWSIVHDNASYHNTQKEKNTQLKYKKR